MRVVCLRFARFETFFYLLIRSLHSNVVFGKRMFSDEILTLACVLCLKNNNFFSKSSISYCYLPVLVLHVYPWVVVLHKDNFALGKLNQ